jgi:hypothetical protein
MALWKAEQKHFEKLLKGDSSVGPEEAMRENMRTAHKRKKYIRRLKDRTNSMKED